eukprot:tig00000681_g3102.t1
MVALVEKGDATAEDAQYLPAVWNTVCEARLPPMVAGLVEAAGGDVEACGRLWALARIGASELYEFLDAFGADDEEEEEEEEKEGRRGTGSSAMGNGLVRWTSPNVGKMFSPPATAVISAVAVYLISDFFTINFGDSPHPFTELFARHVQWAVHAPDAAAEGGELGVGVPDSPGRNGPGLLQKSLYRNHVPFVYEHLKKIGLIGRDVTKGQFFRFGRGLLLFLAALEDPAVRMQIAAAVADIVRTSPEVRAAAADVIADARSRLANRTTTPSRSTPPDAMQLLPSDIRDDWIAYRNSYPPVLGRPAHVLFNTI